MATPINRAAIDHVIGRNIRAFRKRGVYTVRPGYKFTGGWITDKPAIVVTVEKKLDKLVPRDRLPAEVEDIPVDVREATGLQRLRAHDPVAHALVVAHGRPEFHEPQWPDERDVATGRKLSAMPAVRDPALARMSNKPEIPYTPAPNATLDPVTDTMTVIAHASPDAGWPVLRDFLNGTASRLTVGMYDFTSAHVLDTLEAALKPSGRTLELVLDHPPRNPSANQSDGETKQALEKTVGTRAQTDWALTRNDPLAKSWIFPTAYHIKVAVRDGTVFWLSSGNWNNSNQPDLAANDPKAGSLKDADRDWHAVVTHKALAAVFEAYLKHDREVAASQQGPGDDALHATLRDAMQAHEAEQGKSSLSVAPQPKPARTFTAKTFSNVPVTIQPVLTPDKGVYAGKILELLQAAERSLYIQTQYIHPSDQAQDTGFTALLEAVRDKHRKGVDVRLITSQYENTPQWMEKLKEYDLDKVLRIQNRVHNKGIVVDAKVVALGSQNWSGDGTLRNRDATLILHHPDIAQYYEQIFIHDWTTLADVKVVDASHTASSARPASDAMTEVAKRNGAIAEEKPAGRLKAPASHRKAPLTKRARRD